MRLSNSKYLNVSCVSIFHHVTTDISPINLLGAQCMRHIQFCRIELTAQYTHKLPILLKGLQLARWKAYLPPQHAANVTFRNTLE